MEFVENTYTSRIQPLHNVYIIQKRAIGICQKADDRSHSRSLFYQVKTLNIHDMVNFKNMVLMYKVYNKLLPANMMAYFKTINTCHNHNVRMKNAILKSNTERIFICMKGGDPYNKKHINYEGNGNNTQRKYKDEMARSLKRDIHISAEMATDAKRWSVMVIIILVLPPGVCHGEKHRQW